MRIRVSSARDRLSARPATSGLNLMMPFSAVGCRQLI